MTDELDGRRQRAQRTRVKIVDAARSCFLEQGYASTTVDAVADLAGVAAATIYHAFGSKPNLLAAVLDTTLAPAPVVEQAWVTDLLVDADARRALDRLVAAGVSIVDRAAPVYEVVRRAASDPEVAELLDRNRRARWEDQRRLVRLLRRAGHLRRGLGVDSATDVVYALLNEELHALLVGDRGWTLPRFRRWVGEVLAAQLLDRGVTTDR